MRYTIFQNFWSKIPVFFVINLLIIPGLVLAANVDQSTSPGQVSISGGAWFSIQQQKNQLPKFPQTNASSRPKTLVNHMLRTNMETIDWYSSHYIPPDPHMAAGPDHVIITVNASVEWYTKDGVQENSETLADFFSAESPQTGTFDPKVLYDQYSDRFVILTLERTADSASHDTTSKILVAASDGSDPNGTWYTTTINSKMTFGGKVHWADYPGLAVDEEAIYITGNMFVYGGGYDGSRLWIMDKSQLYAGNTPAVNVYNPFSQVGHPNFSTTMKPATVYGGASNFGTFLSTYHKNHSSGGDEFLSVVRVDNPLGTPSFSYHQVNLGNIDSTSLGTPGAPQPGTGVTIDTGDRRALSSVWRDSSLWVSFTVNPPNGLNRGEATAHWVKIDTRNLSSLTLDKQGNIGGEDIAIGTSTFYPAITVDKDGNAAVGFAASGNNVYPGAYYTVILNNSLPGSETYTGVLREGLDFYVLTYDDSVYAGSRNRWGDYSGMAIDPSDNQTFWVFNEYALNRGTPNGINEDGRWGTAFGSFGTDQPFVVAGSEFDGLVPVTWHSDVNASANVVALSDHQLVGELSRSLPKSVTENNTNSIIESSSADHFNIYRSTDFGGPYQVISQVDPSTRNYLHNNDYIDNGVTNNSTYYYAVTSVDGLGNESGFAGASSVTPVTHGQITQSDFESLPPYIDGSLGSDWDNATSFGMHSVSDASKPVQVYFQNSDYMLSVAVADRNNTSDSDYNEVGIYLDTNNDGRWPQFDAGNEGNYWVTDDNGTVTTSFRPLFGTYPNALHAGGAVENPAGVTADVQWDNNSTMIYEIRIDLAASGLNLQPGDTLGVRIYNYDEGRFMNAYYGVENWPYGSIWIAPQTYAKVVLGTSGSPSPGAPILSSVEDVPDDQGGRVQISWQASSAEDSPENPVGYYRILERTQPNTAAESRIQLVQNASTGVHHRISPNIENSGVGSWVAVDSIPAKNNQEYSRIVSTVTDSNQAGRHPTDFKVAAYPASEGEPTFSDVRSGYSVDNIAPTIPTGVSIFGNTESVTLHWMANSDPDVEQYAIYRTSEAANIPASTQTATDLITADTLFTLSGTDVARDYYRIAAIDENGNLSGYSDPVSLNIMATENSGVVPENFTLQQNYPNPFNPTTSIRYALPEKARVTVAIYDLLGNRIVSLVRKTQPAGWYTVQWNGTDELGREVGTGMYLYRINAGEFRAVKKMIYMK